MVLPSEIFKDGEYYLYVLITLPIWILFVWYLTKQYQTKWVINNLESMKEEGVKFNSYLLVLMLFLRDDRYDRTFLSQLQYNHYIKCSSYYHRLDKKMNRKYQKLSLANEESHSEELEKEIQNNKSQNDKNGLRPRGFSFKRCEANDKKLASYVVIDKQKKLSRLYDGGRQQSFPISQQINGSLIDENSLMPGQIEEFKLGDSDDYNNSKYRTKISDNNLQHFQSFYDVSVADQTSQFSSKGMNDFNSDKSPHQHKKGKNVSKFERKLEILSLGIQKFWKTLIQEKQSFEIFQKGLKISQSLNSLSDLYDIIQEKQGENREIKVYILMSGFYKYVVFKPSECMQEIQKSRQVYQTKKIRSQNEIQGMRINQLMPQIIGENHHKFLERFMSTGKCGMLNQQPDINLNFFYEDNDNDHTNTMMMKNNKQAFMIADNTLRIYEMTEDLTLMSKLSNVVLSSMKQNSGIQPQVDDLFYMTNQNGDIVSLINEGVREFEVRLKSEVDLLIHECIINQEDQIANSSGQNSEIQKLKNNTLNLQRLNLLDKEYSYIMRIVSESYMNGGLVINIIALKLLDNLGSSTEKAQNMLPKQMYNMNQLNRITFAQTNQLSGNSNEAREGIKICRLAISRLNRISQIRVIYRQIFSMAQNYVPSTSEIAPDRFDFYSKFVIQLSEELRQTQVQLQQYDFEVEQFQDPIRLKFLMEDSSVTIQERDLGQAVNLFVDRADDLIQRGLRYGKQYFVSKQFFFIFSNEESKYSSLVERDGSSSLKMETRIYFRICCHMPSSLIKQRKIRFRKKIQSRVLILMKIFFDIEKNVVIDIQDRLALFDNLIKPASHQEQQQHIETNNNDQKNQDPQQIISKSKNIQQKGSEQKKYGRKTIGEKSDIEDVSIELQEEIKIEEEDEFDEANKSESNVQSIKAGKRKRRDKHTKDKKFKKSKKQSNRNKKSVSDEEDNDIEMKKQIKQAQQNQQNSLPLMGTFWERIS
eukprot:403377120